MRILEKYVLKNFAVSLLFCISLLMVLGIIGDVLGFMDDIFKNNIPLLSILSFYFYLAPFAFVNMFPFACILSVAFVFNGLSKNHEVTAVIASGLSLWKLLRPILLLTFVLCIVSFIVNDRFVPSTMQKANRIRHEELETGKKGKTIIKNLAIYGKGDQIIFAKSFDTNTNTLNNVIIHRQDREHIVREKVSARLVKWVRGSTWEGTDVIIFRSDADGKFISDPEVFKKKYLDIKEKPKDFINNQWDPRFMSYRQLKHYIKIFSIGSPEAIRRLRVELCYKLSFPFTAIVTILICVPFSIETGRANALIGMVRGISISMLYVPVMAISLALGKGGALPPFLAAWLSNVLFALFGMYFIYKKT